MKTSELLGKLASVFDTVASFMRHVDDVVPMAQPGFGNAMRGHADDIRKMMSDAEAQELADHSADELNRQEAASHGEEAAKPE